MRQSIKFDTLNGFIVVVWTNLDISTSAVNSLFVFHGELNNYSLATVAELGEFGGQSVETSILRGLDALVSFLVTMPFSRGGNELSIVILMLRLNPSVRPGIV
jgi:hypothetical protein